MRVESKGSTLFFFLENMVNKKFNEWFDNIEGAYRPVFFMLFLFSWLIPNAIMIGIAGDTSVKIDMSIWHNQILSVIGGILFFVAIAFAASRMMYTQAFDEGKQ